MFKPQPAPPKPYQGGTIIGLKLGPLWHDLNAYLAYARQTHPKMTRQELVRQMIRYCIDQARAEPWFRG